MQTKPTLLILLCSIAIFLSACQTKPIEINLNSFINNEGLYQYSDLTWGSSAKEISKILEKPLGEPADLGFPDGIEQYTIDGLYSFKEVPAQLNLEFFQDKLYEVRFYFYPADNDLDALFSDISDELTAVYGVPDLATLDEEAYIAELDMTVTSNIYHWETSLDNRITVLSLHKDIRDGKLYNIFLSTGDFSFSSKAEAVMQE